jgi:hypothetical protein
LSATVGALAITGVEGLLESNTIEQVGPRTQEIVMPPAKKAAPAAKKSAAPKKAAPQTTVTLKHLAGALSDSHDLRRSRRKPCWGTW